MKIGTRGCYIRNKDGVMIVPACKGITAVDTIGAGDNFASGFIAALLQGKDIKECAEYANCTAAIAAIRPVLHPRRLMIVDSFIASPPTAIAMLSTGYDSISKTSLDTGRSGISTTAAPRHNTSNFFSTLFISPSVITK